MNGEKSPTGLSEIGSRLDRPKAKPIKYPPTPYRITNMLTALTTELKNHTEADDKWRKDMKELYKARMEEKDKVIEIIQDRASVDEKDKTRWARTTWLVIGIMAAMAGVKAAEIAGLLAGIGI